MKLRCFLISHQVFAVSWGHNNISFKNFSITTKFIELVSLPHHVAWTINMSSKTVGVYTGSISLNLWSKYTFFPHASHSQRWLTSEQSRIYWTFNGFRLLDRDSKNYLKMYLGITYVSASRTYHMTARTKSGIDDRSMFQRRPALPWYT